VNTVSSKAFDSIRIAVSTSFGLGYSPFAPGTISTLPMVALFVLVAKTQPPEVLAGFIAVAFLASCFLSVLLGSWSERYWQRKDPHCFVVDEWAGFFLTVLLFRTANVELTALWTFVATRFFDIVKPPPAGYLQRLPGGWGILLDDLAASLYAAAFLHLAAWALPGLLGR